MTLIAGFKCSDGIVLAADTEESTNYTRGRVRKILEHHAPTGAVIAIAGAGHAPLIDTATEQIFEAIDTVAASTLTELRALIRKRLLRLHRLEIARYPTSDPQETVIDLLYGVRAADGELALFKSSATALSSVDRYALFGIGAILSHVVEELYKQTIDVSRGIALAIHLLNLGKRYVPGVGGDSHIYSLGATGDLFQEPVGEIRIKEKYLDKFNRIIAELLLALPADVVAQSRFGGKVRISTQLRELMLKQSDELIRELIDPSEEQD